MPTEKDINVPIKTDFISREAAIKACKSATDPYEPISHDIAIQCAVAKIKQVPAADVRPVVRGHWIEEDGVQICSECGEEHEWLDYRASFCDCCGADMREKAE